MCVECVENFRVRLKGYEYGFSRSHTARTGQTIGQRNLRRWWIFGGDFVFSRHFVRVLQRSVRITFFIERPHTEESS